MKGTISIIFAAIVVAMLVIVIWGMNIGATPYWETENEFGMWQETLYIEFADGRNESLKLINEGKSLPFSVKYEGADIIRIGLEISASVSGIGYDGAELIYDQSFGVKRSVTDASGAILYSGVSKRPDGTIQSIPIGTTAPILTTRVNIDSLVSSNPSTYPPGVYNAVFQPQGRVRYKGYPDGGGYESIGLPLGRVATVVVTDNGPPGSITVTLSSDIISD